MEKGCGPTPPDNYKDICKIKKREKKEDSVLECSCPGELCNGDQYPPLENKEDASGTILEDMAKKIMVTRAPVGTTSFGDFPKKPLGITTIMAVVIITCVITT